MGKKRDAIIKQMGKENPEWSDDVKTAYKKVMKANRILNEYNKNTKDGRKEYREKFKALAGLSDLIDFLQKLGKDIDSEISKAEKALESIGVDLTGLDIGSQNPRVGRALFHYVPQIDSETPVGAILELAPEIVKSEEDYKAEKENSPNVKLINSLYSLFIGERTKWENEQKKN